MGLISFGHATLLAVLSSFLVARSRNFARPPDFGVACCGAGVLPARRICDRFALPRLIPKKGVAPATVDQIPFRRRIRSRVRTSPLL